MNLYRRKIIPIGKTSYAVILPISWLRYYKLKEGNKLQIIENKKGELIINPLV